MDLRCKTTVEHLRSASEISSILLSCVDSVSIKGLKILPLFYHVDPFFISPSSSFYFIFCVHVGKLKLNRPADKSIFLSL